MRTVRRTKSADEDLFLIWKFIATDNPDAADQLLDQIERRWLILIDHPRAGRARPEFGANVRSLVLREYVIFYEPQGGDIVILRIMHGRQNLQGL